MVRNWVGKELPLEKLLPALHGRTLLDTPHLRLSVCLVYLSHLNHKSLQVRIVVIVCQLAFRTASIGIRLPRRVVGFCRRSLIRLLSPDI